MKKKPVAQYEDSFIGKILQSRFGVIATNWVFQGMRYMNRYEVTVKLSLDVFIFVSLLLIFNGTSNVFILFVYLFISHSINWLLNGHFFTLMRYISPIPKTESDFDCYVNELKVLGEKHMAIDGIALYGSYCRGELHKFSDLDVRVIVLEGSVSGFKGALFCLKERTRAFFKTFPLDIYSCETTGCLDRLRSDEIPVILFDKSGSLSQYYSKKNKAS